MKSISCGKSMKCTFVLRSFGFVVSVVKPLVLSTAELQPQAVSWFSKQLVCEALFQREVMYLVNKGSVSLLPSLKLRMKRLSPKLKW